MAEVPCAFGRRALPKLLEGLAQEPAQEVANTLRTLTAVMANQEAKCEAARLGAAALLVRHLASGERTALACEALQRLAGVLAGRAALAAAGGVAELAGALRGAAAAQAAACLEAISAHPDGATALLAPADGVVAALAARVRRDAGGVCVRAGHAALACLANVLAVDAGVEDALAAGLPATVVALADQALDRAEAAADSDTAARSASAAELLVDCARCLQQLCRMPAGQRAVQAVGGIPCLSRLCTAEVGGGGGDSGGRTTAQCASAALRAIAVEAAGKEAVGAGAAPALARLLGGPDQGAAAAAATALRNVAEHPRARHALAALLASMPAAHQAACCVDLPELPAEWRYNVRAPPPVPLPSFVAQDFGDLHS